MSTSKSVKTKAKSLLVNAMEMTELGNKHRRNDNIRYATYTLAGLALAGSLAYGAYRYIFSLGKKEKTTAKVSTATPATDSADKEAATPANGIRPVPYPRAKHSNS